MAAIEGTLFQTLNMSVFDHQQYSTVRQAAMNLCISKLE